MLTCESDAVAKVETGGDLPELYFFRVDGNTLLYCELYPEDLEGQLFPTTGFAISRVHGREKRVLVEEVTCLGEPLLPERTLSGAWAKQVLATLRPPAENFELLDGTLDRLEEATLRPPLGSSRC